MVTLVPINMSRTYISVKSPSKITHIPRGKYDKI
jgi:hypothetical protein